MDLNDAHILHGLFNADWYLNYYPDVRLLGMDPWDHYLQIGASLDRYLFQDVRGSDAIEILKLITSSDKIDESILACHANEIRNWCHSTTEHNQFLHGRMESMEPLKTDIRAIALYLPQFHAIPENDTWWGKGFTEWTNVRRGKPLYQGHYQPHVPHYDIGYYDLNDETVLEKQASMAKAAGIEGFCFYYYWFNGRRLLNMPTDRLVASGKPDFPFCFCWANENWTRTWDGGDKQILMEQRHSQESDERFIMGLLSAFRDSRYIRVDGKPLLIIYRPGLLPDPAATASHWRETCRREGIGEIYLARMQMFDWELNNKDIGYDAVIQFPPVASCYSNDFADSVQLNDPNSFSGHVYDYKFTSFGNARAEIGDNMWPGVAPSWDNTSRRLERGTSWINATPERYYRWLKTVANRIRKNIKPSHRFILINAWNEWAEGCHLEPDKKFGYQWLNATRQALAYETNNSKKNRKSVLVIGHDAARAGAQMVLLTMLREWRVLNECDFQLVLLRGGVLREEFEKVCETLVIDEYGSDNAKKEALKRFCSPDLEVILANTVVVGPFLPMLMHLNVPIVTYVHELQKSIERWAPGEIMEATLRNSDHFIAVSTPVAENLICNHNVPLDKISNLNPYIKISQTVEAEQIDKIRKELGIPQGAKIVFGCGTMDWRKGPDLFAKTALRVIKNVPEAHFIWIGADTGDESGKRAKSLAIDPRIQFIGERENPRDYFALGSVFFLSSREDPYPLVTLEAADAGLPAVCFAESGGMPDFVGNSCGRTVPYEDVDVAAEALIGLLTKDSLRESLGKYARDTVRLKHDSTKGSQAVLSTIKSISDRKSTNSTEKGKPLVSVIVPNFNHAAYLPERLESIARQTLSNFEIILMDDFSTDESLEVLRAFAAREPRARLVLNSENSGSTFKQWRKGFAEAKGKYIWIAESDDFAEPTLLETLVGRLESNPAAALAACCPCSIEGEIEHGPPRQWYNELLGIKWESDYTANGLQEIREVLSRRNSILNASGVVFRNFSGISDLVEQDMRLCADWLFWVRLLRNGDFEYSHRMLNKWRINSSNARTRPPGDLEWREGRRVLEEIATILNMEGVERANILNSFSRECQSWLTHHLETASLNANLKGTTPRVTAIVPNFNYASYLPERLESILGQTCRDLEILVLDDASTDSSLEIIESYRQRFPNLIRVLPNSINSGSPYPQWLRGIREAKGDLVWIAEADDSCEPDFLEVLLPYFEDCSVGIAYCQSLGLDEHGRVTRTDFLEHTEQLHQERWKGEYKELGIREAIDWMAYRNTIPNASAALIRREALHDLGEELLSYRSNGDWFLYLYILRHWNVGYCPRSLNKFRRHSRAVTRTNNQSEAYLREVAMIRRFVSNAFPLHNSQIPRLDHFLDRDYVFEGIPKPSQHPATRSILQEAERNTIDRLRLAFISTNISAHSGGSEVLWQKAALEARRRGHDVIAVTKAWRPLPSFSAEFTRVGIKHLETEHGGHDAVISFRPDLAIISTGNQDEGWLEFQKFPPAGIPYVVVNHLTKEESISPLTNFNGLLREGISQAKRVFFTSKNNQQLLERRLGVSIPHSEVFFNSLDIPRDFMPPPPEHADGFQLAFPARILFIHKGHDILLQVMALEKWRQRSLTINIYGHGEDENDLQDSLSKHEIRNVYLRGYTTPEEIWKRNHAILLASRMEGQSMAMIGAMVAGRVPIVTAVGGSAEVIADNKTGFLAAHPTPEHLDDAMERAWQRRYEWHQIGKEARESVLNLVPDDPVGDFVNRIESIAELIGKDLETKVTSSSDVQGDIKSKNSSHLKNTGLVSIDLDRTLQSSGLYALELSGNNSGNILFTYGSKSQCKIPEHLGFEFEDRIHHINSSFSSIVVPAANWIIAEFDFGSLAKQLSQITIPICVVGLGSQTRINHIQYLPKGSIDFLKEISKKSSLIGVRGEKTKEILKALGIENVLVCGCPSIFPNFHLPPVWEKVKISQHTRISISFTRYGRNDPDQGGYQRQLAELAARIGSSIILQSEADEISYLQEPNQETAQWLCQYYQIKHADLPSLIRKMQFFTSQEKWVAFHRENTDLTISSRIHGCIASLLAGKPAILLAHDQRTQELAQTMGIPQLSIETFKDIRSKEDLNQYLSILNESLFREKQFENLEKLKQVYRACGVNIICE